MRKTQVIETRSGCFKVVGRQTESEWKAAYDQVRKSLKEYVALIGDPGVNPCIGLACIHIALMRYNLGERTEDLYQEMIGIR